MKKGKNLDRLITATSGTFLGITPVSSVSNGLYFLTLPLVSVMRVGVRVIYRKIRYFIFLYYTVGVATCKIEKHCD